MGHQASFSSATTDTKAAGRGEHYDDGTIWLHWLTAILVVCLWGMAQIEDFVPRGPARHALWSTHIVLGLGLILVFAVRIAWRLGYGRALPAKDRGALHVLAKATHWGLYALVAITLSLGVANLLARGWDLFGLVQVPAYTAERSMRRSINGWHDWAANATLAVAAFHAAAALVHHYVWRDGLLSRMRSARFH